MNKSGLISITLSDYIKNLYSAKWKKPMAINRPEEDYKNEEELNLSEWCPRRGEPIYGHRLFLLCTIQIFDVVRWCNGNKPAFIHDCMFLLH